MNGDRLKLLLGLGLGGAMVYLLTRRETPVVPAGQPALATVMASGGIATSYVAPSTGPSTQQLIGKIGGSAAAVVGAINPAAGAVVGAATVVASLVAGLFSSTPPDPVIRLLLAELPYPDWPVRSNLPPGARVYGPDAYGYLHPLQASLSAAGYLDREVVLVNSVVFSMMPIAAPYTLSAQLDPVAMPRPADGQIIRAVLGNSARFYLGRDLTLHGPWESTANAEVIAGTPAAWEQIAGTYQPTVTASPGEY